ncbi:MULTISPECIES: efflux transporter outer membrane subunit [unclassified Pseudomonas]|uniref:efflux transporter outer membrane subunit n=1 Tax=unclassified Pseudomonas TaxID=196821 RepID=UPI0024490B57|nr:MULTISPECIES: efflux transporter outer membrane subunit [unclassified Pseudomonas]MDH0301926.1 efflux transporter outer membrane subunit [Pseudomonas sp. GD04091]MDH1983786.1 efflux transporter outer membrane subunit [Pseudomonas sp. GD03689]
MRGFALILLTAALAGCSLIPDYQRPDAPVASHYPSGPAYSDGATGATAEQWQAVFQDPALRQLIDTALANNRDLRVALLNVEASRAQYRIQRAELLPAVSANASGQRQYLPRSATGSGDGMIRSTYAANLGISAYELDLFGRVRSASAQALQTYLASEQARRGAQLSLVASVATVYLTWRADQELLELSQRTLAADEQSLRLTTRQRRTGTLSALDQIQAQTRVDSTRAAVARYRRLAAQDLNQLTLLVGGPFAPPQPAQPLAGELIAQIPAGLPSQLLQRRPDILEAEHRLQAANANIGAARAAFFPSISLTANAGGSSLELSNLFKAGSGSWLFQPQISLPVFNAGSLRASLDYARLQKDIQVAQYEKAIQTAFQEVADGLAARATYQRQLQAQRDLVAASQRYYDLAQNRYRTGVDSSLTFLDAQRELFSAQQGLIGDRLAQLVAEVNLYTALGGGWSTTTEVSRQSISSLLPTGATGLK